MQLGRSATPLHAHGGSASHHPLGAVACHPFWKPFVCLLTTLCPPPLAFALQDYQWDMTWVVIKQLEKWGLASNIKLPSEKQKERLRLPKRTWEGAAIKA